LGAQQPGRIQHLRKLDGAFATAHLRDAVLWSSRPSNHRFFENQRRVLRMTGPAADHRVRDAVQLRQLGIEVHLD
jgi:hypothetical protein